MSLVIVRTEKGQEVIRRAIEGGAVRLVPVDPKTLSLSQRELQLKRGAIWGRVTTMKLLGVPAPRFRGFSLFRNWLRIPITHKLRSTFGTARRVISRKYFRKQPNLFQPTSCASDRSP